MELRSKSESRHGNLAPVKAEGFDTGFSKAGFHPWSLHAASVYFSFFSFFPPALFFFFPLSYLFWNTLQLQRVPRPRTTCSQTTQPRMPIQMKSALQLPRSWDHFTSSWQLLKKRKKERKKTTIEVSHLVSFECEKALRVKKYKAANGNLLHRNPHPCILLPGNTKHTRPKGNIRSTWNSAPNLQTSYHDCTCKLVR